MIKVFNASEIDKEKLLVEYDKYPKTCELRHLRKLHYDRTTLKLERVFYGNQEIISYAVRLIASTINFDLVRNLEFEFKKMDKQSIVASAMLGNLIAFNSDSPGQYSLGQLLAIIAHELTHCYIYHFKLNYSFSHGIFFLQINKMFLDILLDDDLISKVLDIQDCQQVLKGSKKQFLDEACEDADYNTKSKINLFYLSGEELDEQVLKTSFDVQEFARHDFYKRIGPYEHIFSLNLFNASWKNESYTSYREEHGDKYLEAINVKNYKDIRYKVPSNNDILDRYKDFQCEVRVMPEIKIMLEKEIDIVKDDGPKTNDEYWDYVTSLDNLNNIMDLEVNRNRNKDNMIQFTLEVSCNDNGEIFKKLGSINVFTGRNLSITKNVNGHEDWCFIVPNRNIACQVINIVYGPENSSRDSNAFHLGEVK